MTDDDKRSLKVKHKEENIKYYEEMQQWLKGLTVEDRQEYEESKMQNKGMFNIVLSPIQNILPFEAEIATGFIISIVIVIVAVSILPNVLVAITWYVVIVLGFTLIDFLFHSGINSISLLIKALTIA